MKPFFSVVTACKDQLEFVVETAQSLRAQTDQDFEWIFIDDASSQNLKAALHADRIPQLRYFKNSQGLGQTASLNRGIQMTNSSWIVRVDGDDLLPADRLSLTRRAIEAQPAAKLLAGAYDVISETGEALAQVRYRNSPGAILKYLKTRNNPLCHPSVCFWKFRKNQKLFLYDERLKNAQDYALWQEILSEFPDGLAIVHEPMVRYRLVRGALSGSRIREQMEELSKVKKGDLSAASLTSTRDLSRKQAEGMYHYRVAYFLFLDSASFSWRKFKDALTSLARSAKYPPVFPKAMFFSLGYGFKTIGKTLLFRGIYR